MKASGAALETAAGNWVVGAAASVWRRPGGTGPEEELHSEALRLEVSVPVASAGPGWGWGVLGGFVTGPGGGGWFVGGQAQTPAARLLFGVEAALVAGGGGGPNGVAAGWLGVLFR